MCGEPSNHSVRKSLYEQDSAVNIAWEEERFLHSEYMMNIHLGTTSIYWRKNIVIHDANPRTYTFMKARQMLLGFAVVNIFNQLYTFEFAPVFISSKSTEER